MPNLFQSINSGMAELKNYYQGPIVSQFNDDLPILRGAERVKKGWSGLQVVRPLKTHRNQGIGATSDGGVLPAIGRQGVVQAIIPSAFNYLRFGVTGPMIKASKSDVGSFVRSAAYELEQGFKDLKADVNRQLSWDGTGTLARLNATVAGASSVVIKGREDVETALKFIDVNMVVDVVDGGSVVASGITVTAITAGTAQSATATISLSAPISATVNASLVHSNSYLQEIKGLLYELDGLTTTVFNVDRSANIQFQGNVNDMGGAQLTLDALQATFDSALLRGDGKLSALYSDFPTRRMYQKLLTADKRYVNTIKGDGGFSSKDQNYLEFNGIPWVADQSCPQRLFYLPPEVIIMYILAEMEFADETGSMYIAQTSSDEFEVRIRYFAQLFNEKPAATAVLRNYISP